MMRIINRFILVNIVLVTLLGLITAGIDNYRMTHGENPIFNKTIYYPETRNQIYQGLFYKARRKIKVSTREPISESKKIKFYFLGVKSDIVPDYKEEKPNYTTEIAKEENCSISTLYHSADNIKIYTYCIKDIQINENNKNTSLKDLLQKDKSFIDDLETNLSYIGLAEDLKTQVFNSKDNNSTNNGLTMYKCNNNDINDIYLVPLNTKMQSDFCTYKEDNLTQ